MNKLNRKGFTLIEMLVVIAIIAVLVAIIVPTVSNATEKSKAAADAANLRTFAASVAIESMEGTPNYTGIAKPTAKLAGLGEAVAYRNNDTINAYFLIGENGISVEQLASVADGTATWDTVKTQSKAIPGDKLY